MDDSRSHARSQLDAGRRQHYGRRVRRGRRDESMSARRREARSRLTPSSGDRRGRTTTARTSSIPVLAFLTWSGESGKWGAEVSSLP